MRVAYIHSHITKVQATSASTGVIMPCSYMPSLSLSAKNAMIAPTPGQAQRGRRARKKSAGTPGRPRRLRHVTAARSRGRACQSMLASISNSASVVTLPSGPIVTLWGGMSRGSSLNQASGLRFTTKPRSSPE